MSRFDQGAPCCDVYPINNGVSCVVQKVSEAVERIREITACLVE